MADLNDKARKAADRLKVQGEPFLPRVQPAVEHDGVCFTAKGGLVKGSEKQDTATRICRVSVIPFSDLVEYIEKAKKDDGVAPASLELKLPVGDEWKSVKLKPDQLLAVDKALKEAGVTNGNNLGISGKEGGVEFSAEKQTVTIPADMLNVPADKLQQELGSAFKSMRQTPKLSRMI